MCVNIDIGSKNRANVYVISRERERARERSEWSLSRLMCIPLQFQGWLQFFLAHFNHPLRRLRFCPSFRLIIILLRLSIVTDYILICFSRVLFIIYLRPLLAMNHATTDLLLSFFFCSSFAFAFEFVYFLSFFFLSSFTIVKDWMLSNRSKPLWCKPLQLFCFVTNSFRFFLFLLAYRTSQCNWKS